MIRTQTESEGKEKTKCDYYFSGKVFKILAINLTTSIPPQCTDHSLLYQWQLSLSSYDKIPPRMRVCERWEKNVERRGVRGEWRGWEGCKWIRYGHEIRTIRRT